MADPRTASQRISDLERAVMSVYNAANGMARELGLIKSAMKLLDSKVSAIVEASAAGSPVNDETISAIMRRKELEEFKAKVTNLVEQKVLVPTETIDDPAIAFVVGSENEPDAADGTPGKVMHARLQFTIESLGKTPEEKKEIQDKFKGAKAGDTITFKAGEAVFKLLETYKVQNPPAPEVPEVVAPAADPNAPAPVTTFVPADINSVPAATQSSSDASTPQADPVAAPASQSTSN